MSDKKINVQRVVQLFVDQAKDQAKKEKRLDIRAELIPDFTNMDDEEIAKWFEDYGLVMNSGRLDSEVMRIIDPTAEVGQMKFNLPSEENFESAYNYFMQKVEDSVTDNDYMDDKDWDGRIGNPGERMEESKKHKKYSSFKNQQTITENFRKYVNEVGYYGLGMDAGPPESPEDRNKELANLAIESGDEEKIKGYILALKHIGRYGFNEDGFNEDGFNGINRRGDRMAPPEWNEGWKKALQDWDDSEAETFSDFGKWLAQGDDPYSHYEDEDDLEYADFQDDDDYTRSESQQTITENFRRFLKEDDWKDGHMEEAGNYLDTSYDYSLGGHDHDDLIIKPEILAQYMMNMMKHEEKANFAAKIAEIAKAKLDLGNPTRRSKGPAEFTWPKKHKEATLAALSAGLDGDKYAIAVRTIEKL